ncbi:hypothetical protein H9L13_07070 [Sphingomonas lutea]|uniref:Tetratricopeptide repeat protein n=1 Tax=Sphingomonas lutea TaxID=1045317 RepID=A0A7G9SF62_9SPHN|nr:hypothetical protein [Sphingomonas lutea]QNN66487.1 hypothetical protein H9L13_07070 [Sphingomonas lutea]
MATKTASRAKARTTPLRDELPSTSDPVEIAMAVASSGKPLPDAARSVLEKHAKLIDRQAELAHAQCGELKLRRVGEGVRAALWAILAIAALAIVGVIAAVVIRASRSDALVVQSFRVPPALAARGLTGEVVATQVLDKLAEMQEGTESVRAASTYANNWEDELKIDIPNTGATTDQVWKVLRGWLGKETRISGEVIDLGGGLALTARVGTASGQRFVSSQGDLDALIAQGAELIFKRTQPYRHAVYVGRVPEREAERYALLTALTADPSEVERKWAFSGLAYDRREMGFFADAARAAHNALAIDPEMTPARGNLAIALRLMGRDQEAFDAFEAELSSKATNQYDPRIAAANRCSSLTSTGEIMRNAARLEEGIACVVRAPGSYSQYVDELRASLALLRRDPGPALAIRALPKSGEQPEEGAAVAAEYKLSGEMLRGPSPALTQALATLQSATAAREAKRAYHRNSAPVYAWPVQVEALVMLKRADEAAALAGRMPRDCYNCVRARGMAARAMGEAAAAQRWFAEAVRQGPRLPAAYVDWGRLLSQHRRWASAEQRFARAAELSPNWADPLKYWGDALAAQGKRDAAQAKYDAALKLAPRWAELNRARRMVVRR